MERKITQYQILAIISLLRINAKHQCYYLINENTGKSLYKYHYYQDYYHWLDTSTGGLLVLFSSQCFGTVMVS
jgi:hypothetical protein